MHTTCNSCPWTIKGRRRSPHSRLRILSPHNLHSHQSNTTKNDVGYYAPVTQTSLNSYMFLHSPIHTPSPFTIACTSHDSYHQKKKLRHSISKPQVRSIGCTLLRGLHRVILVAHSSENIEYIEVAQGPIIRVFQMKW
jgi:hypothetical protein